MSGEKEKKELLRERIKKLRSRYSAGILKNKSGLIKSLLVSLPEYKNSRVVMFYVSTIREVFTHDLIESAIAEGKKVAVPFIPPEEDVMYPCPIEEFRDLKCRPWGILQPTKEKCSKSQAAFPDLVIVPGLAFDRVGNRLGRGRGFYDRFLRLVDRKIPKIALAFSYQVIERIPIASNDVPVDKIITEDGVIECGNTVISFKLKNK